MSAMKDYERYERVRVEGIIKVITPLCIGSGVISHSEDKEQNSAEKPAKTPEILEVCVVNEDDPYLPATSLRGLLSALAKARLGANSEMHETLFGTARDAAGRMGALRVARIRCAVGQTR